ncbi:DNA polymerase III subunit delta [Pasteurellaceae bacterium Macca]|nr:DNA polymerase III subunit delta [Pasteurellaceae bacterium Macca]
MLRRIFPEALDLALNKGLTGFYLLTGQDLLLVGESKDAIVQSARLQGFDEKIEQAITNDTPWDRLFDQVQAGGLFFTRQILILNLPESITASQQKQLANLLAFAHSDLLFILHAPKWSKSNEKQAWFSQIEENALVVSCQTPDIQKLPIWLKQRAKKMALDLDNEAIQLLCYSYEGNLLALKQALQMLQLRFVQEHIGLNRAKEVIEQSAQFTPFQWVDALLLGKTKRASRILNHLQHEEVQPVVLLRIVQKELLLLLEMTRSPQPIADLNQPLYLYNLRTEFDRLKVWQNRRGLYQHFAQQHSYAQLYRLIQALTELERKVKQAFSDEIWLELARFGLLFK